MRKSIILSKICGAIFFLLFFSVVYAQDNGSISPFGGVTGIFRSGIYIIAEGEVDAANTYKESLDERPFTFNYSVSASAEKGKTVFFNSVSSIPVLWKDDRLIRTGTVLGYDAQGTDGSLKGSESIGSAACGENAVIGMSAGVVFDLKEGTIATGSRTESYDYKSEFSTMAYGEGAVSTLTNGASISFVKDDDGDYARSSSTNYNQSVAVQGSIGVFRQTSNMSASGIGCGVW